MIARPVVGNIGSVTRGPVSACSADRTSGGRLPACGWRPVGHRLQCSGFAIAPTAGVLSVHTTYRLDIAAHVVRCAPIGFVSPRED